MGERELVRYTNLVHDSVRWQGFELRADDIIISTPAKCGTTWTQMICALLVLQTPELEESLSAYSPWLDMRTRARSEVVAALGAQQHRRFIKTHTPLDGLPLHPTATYICVGRDPRDAALSMDNHQDNMDLEAFLTTIVEAAAIDGEELPPFQPPPPPPESARERFWLWVDNETPPAQSGSSLLLALHHLGTFWDAPPDLDVVMLHYDDLKTDLAGQMRALAHRLRIDVPDDRWDDLIEAATFERMRASASITAPRVSRSLWRDDARFFNRGTSGQWRDLLDEHDLRRYRERVAGLVSPELAAWAHHES